LFYIILLFDYKVDDYSMRRLAGNVERMGEIRGLHEILGEEF